MKSAAFAAKATNGATGGGKNEAIVAIADNTVLNILKKPPFAFNV
jgi:hypothetical protein